MFIGNVEHDNEGAFDVICSAAVCTVKRKNILNQVNSRRFLYVCAGQGLYVCAGQGNQGFANTSWSPAGCAVKEKDHILTQVVSRSLFIVFNILMSMLLL